MLVWATLLLLHAAALYTTASNALLLLAGCSTLVMDSIWMSYEGSTTSTVIPILLPVDTDSSFACMWSRVWIHLLVLVGTTMHGVCLYVYTYMQQEVLCMSFSLQLILFMASMCGYITTTAPLMVLMLWEYLGTLSYVLIQHWGNRVLAVLGSSKSLLYNRVLDTVVVLMVSIAWIHSIGVLGALGNEERATHADSVLILMLSIKLITVGVHSWLPDAMEGPTAVSSVIHAATLVVAGALWLLRAPCSTWLCWYSAILSPTMLLCYGICSCACTDAKRVVAYSTAWNIAVVSSLTMTSYGDAIAHMEGHALYKACLFMSLGLLLHSTAQQDSRVLASITANTLHSSMMSVCIYQSTGWLYSSTWGTKKEVLDNIWFHGPTSGGWILIALSFSAVYSLLLIMYTTQHSMRNGIAEDGVTGYCYIATLLLLAVSLQANVLSTTTASHGRAWGMDHTACTVGYIGWWYMAVVLSVSAVMLIGMHTLAHALPGAAVWWGSTDAVLARGYVVLLAVASSFASSDTIATHWVLMSSSSSWLACVGTSLLLLLWWY
nr:NADH dehydrogenase subunit 5 [Rhynchopus humris]